MPHEHPTARLAVPLLVAASFAMAATAACGGGVGAGDRPGESNAAGGPASASGPDAPSPGRGVFFPKHGGGVMLQALIEGTLVLDGRGCIRLRGDGPAPTPIWPPDHSSGTGEGGEEPGAVRILDGKGRVKAKAGDGVRLAGGFAADDSLEDATGVDERTRRELHERCPGPYWYVSEIERVPPRGK